MTEPLNVEAFAKMTREELRRFIPIGNDMCALRQACYNVTHEGKTVPFYELFRDNPCTSKLRSIHFYSSKKRNGCYARLASPKVTYTLFRADGKGFDCPKYLYEDTIVEEKNYKEAL